MRLHKYMALCGVASRRKSEVIIGEGRVQVNGQVVNSGIAIDENTDEIKVDGQVITLEDKKVYILLNKPLDCVTTSSDQFGRKTVMDYVTDIQERVYPVGRLDYNTTGLLLLTNDGDLAKKIMHPSSHLNKVYIAKVKGQPSQEKIDQFKKGLMIDDKTTSPAGFSLKSYKNGYSIVEVTIYEGRNRQVRKMLEKIGHPVVTLKRVAIGDIGLGDVALGTYRHLSGEEIKYLKDY